ncbi:hypothetical protein niasHS_009118 [Heterodera schachtii]|uniref:Phorbol-ester/DAG-type domain-containing protein n=1 Tax=Heterodera schachtii TaxID=97005 RepID=A0ABD2JDZ1_HETSC
MDGFWWICAAWLFVAVVSLYVFFSRRSAGPKVPTIQIDDENGFSLETQQNFANDLLNWLLWGNSGTNLGTEQQLVLSPLLAKFVLNSLNEAAQRVGKKTATIDLKFDNLSAQTVDSQSIQICSKQSLFHNIRVHPNEASGNYLSIHTKLSYTKKSMDDGIRLDISVSTDEQNQPRTARQNGIQMRKIPIVMGPSLEHYTVIIDQINGDVETRLVFIAGELFVISCFRDRPTIQLRMVGTNSKADEILSYIKRCIISAVLNFSIGELLYPDNESIERASKARLSAEYRNLSFVNEMYPTSQTPTLQKTPPRSMSPKFPIIVEDVISPEELASANRLNIQLIEIFGVSFKFNQQPFVCIEMDEPNQRFLSIKADHQGQGPDGQPKAFWDEHRANFEFTISPVSNELLFEVFYEEEAKLGSQSANCVRERKFCGTAILSLAELRQAVQQQRRTIELQLQGRPYMEEKQQQQRNRKPSQQQLQQQQHQQEMYGVLVIRASLRNCHGTNRPLVKQQSTEFVVPLENGHHNHQLTQSTKSWSPFAYPGDNQQHHPPPLSPPIKKYSTTGSESSSTIKRSLTRQKQHYIYNVTDDEGHSPSYDRQYGAGSSCSPDPCYNKASPARTQFEYQTTNNVVTDVQSQQQQPIRPVGAVRKTTSDTNALFQYDAQTNGSVERKKSAPISTMLSVSAKQQQQQQLQQQEPEMSSTKFAASQLVTKQHSLNDETLNNNEFEHLFEQQKKLSVQQQQQQQQQQRPQASQGHPAMATFEMPDKMKRLAVGSDPVEFERISRERDRKAAPKKRERSFFEQVRARLAGPVRLLPGRDGKRAKSYDDNENRPMEEVAASMPTSRDQSQARQMRQRKGSNNNNQFEPVYNQQIFVNTTTTPAADAFNGGSAAQSMLNLEHSPKNAVENGGHSSQLVLELIGTEEEKPRYYAIPSEVQSEPAVIKLMQSGKKLHIYEWHIFVAVKPRGRVLCAVCGKKIGGNFTTRQAYQCRDCRMACHKSCHLSTNWACTNSSIFSMNIEEVDWPEFLRHNQLKEFISSVGL